MNINSNVIHSDPDILGGVPVFKGTRVPAKTLLDYMEKGHTVAEFVDDFPTVSLTQAQSLLADLKREMIAA